MTTDARKPKPPRRGFRLVECDGAAHSNPFIDHCMTCAPRWGWVEIPEEYQTLDEYRAAVDKGEIAIVGTGAIVDRACHGRMVNTPGKRATRCDACGHLDYEANEGDPCTK